MKTTTTTNFLKNSLSVIQFRNISLLLLFNFLVFTSGLTAQNKTKQYEKFGLRASSSISANRFGSIYSPSVFYKSGRSLYSAGMMIQKENTHAAGLQTNYEYTLLDGSTGECYIPWLELYAFANLSYYNNVFLSDAACAEEHQQNPELKMDLSRVKLNSIDSYTGFGLRVKFLKNFTWYGCIGIGGYDVLNAPSGIYYNTRSAGMLYRTGISYQFNRASNKMNF